MPNKMLIDASHQEETRVVVVRGNRIEEFDFESQDKKQLKGNIYLARVTRVEPSLQAAFVEYGGNRHGFLAFSEIHPDYYQIPLADRQAILRAEAEDAANDDDEDGDGEERRGRNRRRRAGKKGQHRNEDSAAEASGETESSDDEAATGEELVSFDETIEESVETSETEESPSSPDEDDQPDTDDDAPKSIAAAIESDVVSEPVADENARNNVEDVQDGHDEDSEVESVGAEDAIEEARDRRKQPRRQYKIQEVIKRRQILLVQVVKEERGNKGAALTTYLSLAGRYSVLMPNTARGGGISRKITNAQDRKRLKEVVQDLDVPQGMGVILRTAGESRTKAEIKRDYEYLMRMWETVRSTTLQATAPALVYEEGSLIKRSVRDLYNKDIDEVLVSGEEGYREAKDFMRMLMPSHAKVVQPYRDTTPIFVRSGIEAQLDKMLQPQVTLKSGGYIIINQTEALVAIDVNSGRSTKEHSIEETALHTNLEAAEEVARQLRLRDLAGLIVIDFIDMEENRNNRAVEKRLKDHLKNDRARIQLGRISHFGLMEMSRQRIRASVLESTMKPCPHCGGTGHVRSDSSVALMVVRAIEEFLLKDSRNHITVRTPVANALYILNHKRATLVDLETRFGLTITLEADDSVDSQHYTITRGAVAEKPAGFVEITSVPLYIEPEEPEDDIVEIIEDEEEETVAAQPQQQPATERSEDGDNQRDRKRRRRRRRRGGRDRDGASETTNGESVAADSENGDDSADDENGDEAVSATEASAPGEDGERKKRRRGKRGGKRSRKDDEGSEASASEQDGGDAPAEEAPAVEEPVVAPEPVIEEAPETEEKPKKAPRRSRAKKVADETVTDETVAVEKAEAKPAKAPKEKKPAKPRAPRKKAAASGNAEETVAEAAAEPKAPEAVETPAPAKSKPAAEPAEPAPATEPAEDKPKRGGWWQRKSFF
ncbi:Rne/Rng family ribonuclease [Mesorhizobium sp. SB112]|uniref:Rne/Rng family ribonuclease n=1 Tax=Mesorhizobium sp. SB112 TaxID=3151853 RepID=UPI003265042E